MAGSLSTSRERLGELFAPQLELCDELRERVWLARPPRTEINTEARAVLGAILRRAIDTYEGTLQLCRRALPLQALMLVRSLFEDMVSAFWLSVPGKQDVGLRRLRDQDDFMVLLSNDVVRKYPHRFLVAADDHPDLEARRKDFERSFGRYASKSWLGDLHQAIQDIKPTWERVGGKVEDLGIYYDVIHRHANLHLHNTSLAVLQGVQSYDEEGGFDTQDVDTALRAAYWCLMGLATIVADQFGHDRSELKRLASEGERVFMTLTPARRAKIGRNDPCWCGSGKKLKKCHGS